MKTEGMTTPRNLSSLFEAAARELTQIKESFGDRHLKTACATGAVVYYWGDKKSNALTYLFKNDIDELMRAFSTWLYKKHQTKPEILSNELSPILYFNDRAGWSFYDFAQEARQFEKETHPHLIMEERK